MSVLYSIDKSTLEGIGNAIRRKKGTTEPIPVTSLASEIASIGESEEDSTTIKVGTYKMVEYQYEGSYSGSFAWGSQALSGKITYTNQYSGEIASNEPFSTIDNDGVYSIDFKNNGTAVVSIIPSFSPDYDTIKIVIEEDQTVEETFKNWFVACFEKEADKSKLAQIVDRTVTEITAKDLAGITKIGNYAFYECKQLTSVEIPETVTSIGERAFIYCENLPSIAIPDAVTEIGGYAFGYCDNLESITIPKGVTTLGQYMFRKNSKLTNINFAEDIMLTSICQYAFADCMALLTINIPNSVTSIGAYAFSNCTSLMSITMEGDTPPTIQSNTLQNVPLTCPIYIKNPNAVEAYKTATNWSVRADYIFAKTEDTHTIEAGTYTYNGGSTGAYFDMPYPTYIVEANINGQLNTFGNDMGTVTKMTLSGCGQGGDANNSLTGAPYVEVNFFNGDTSVYNTYLSEVGASDISITISEDVSVSADFYKAFTASFT